MLVRILFLFQTTLALNYQLTTVVETKSKFCFFETFENGTTVTFQVQVLSRGEINFFVYNPEQTRIMLMLSTKKRFIESIQVVRKADYMVCLDNSGGLIGSDKKVLLQYSATSETDYEDPQTVDTDHEFSETVSVIYQAIQKIRRNVLRSRQAQGMTKSSENRDNELLLNNNSLVTNVSITAVIVSLIWGYAQVAVIKSMFPKNPRKTMI